MGGRIIAIGLLATAWTALSGAGCVVDAGAEGQPASADTELEAEARKKCGNHPSCMTDQYCARDVGDCSSGGACQRMPDVCSQAYDPACGCDGVTYSNACFAAMMGASVKFQGTCEADCFSNAECGNGFCRKAAGACGGLGVCQPKPVACNQLVAPVCGCDGATYSNACFAALDGVNLGASGECL